MVNTAKIQVFLISTLKSKKNPKNHTTVYMTNWFAATVQMSDVVSLKYYLAGLSTYDSTTMLLLWLWTLKMVPPGSL